MAVYVAPWQYREMERSGKFDMTKFAVGVGPEQKPVAKPVAFTNREARRAANRARRRKG